MLKVVKDRCAHNVWFTDNGFRKRVRHAKVHLEYGTNRTALKPKIKFEGKEKKVASSQIL